MTTLAATIAEEIFRTIERERRINKDDLIQAVERCLSGGAMPYRDPPKRVELSNYHPDLSLFMPTLMPKSAGFEKDLHKAAGVPSPPDKDRYDQLMAAYAKLIEENPLRTIYVKRPAELCGIKTFTFDVEKDSYTVGKE